MKHGVMAVKDMSTLRCTAKLWCEGVIMRDLASFKCRQCGMCCRAGGYVPLRDGEVDVISAYLGITADDFFRRYMRMVDDVTGFGVPTKEDGACVFLNMFGKCSIQDVKPQNCRDFPIKWTEDDLQAGREAMRGRGLECEAMKEFWI